MDLAVGIRGSVVQDKALLPAPCLPDPPIQLPLPPALLNLRLPLGEVGPHGEVRPGEIDRLPPVHAIPSQKAGSPCQRAGAPRYHLRFRHPLGTGRSSPR